MKSVYKAMKQSGLEILMERMGIYAYFTCFRGGALMGDDFGTLLISDYLHINVHIHFMMFRTYTH